MKKPKFFYKDKKTGQLIPLTKSQFVKATLLSHKALTSKGKCL